MKPRIIPLGDASVLVQLGDEIDLAINQRVQASSNLIETASINGMVETVPAYATLRVHYDPLILSFAEIKEHLQAQMSQLDETFSRMPRRIEVPVYYGGEYGIDLETVAAHLHLSAAEVIRIHSETLYTVYMMGFTPGYPYMGRLDDRLSMPRLETPRTRVPAGTVAIAGSQTGIYSIESPGGWNLIGWTPLRLFDPASNSPFLFAPGDEVKFIPEHVT
jgi:inhibitor of KinA